MPSKKRPHSIGRSDLLNNEQISNDIYQSSFHNNGLFPTINPASISNTNHISSPKNILTRPKILQTIEENIIGKDFIFQGPWGLRRSMLLDLFNKNFFLFFFLFKWSIVIIQHQVEHYNLLKIISEMMYFLCKKTEVFNKEKVFCFSFFSFIRYGNTHSETSLCAQQSTKFREEARNIIKKSINANENDVLLFTGTGSTGAVHTLVDNFELNDETIRQNTVVIVSAFEHHSNILPWQETGVKVK